LGLLLLIPSKSKCLYQGNLVLSSRQVSMAANLKRVM
jgi:hypothetical protein